jgi:hypothetical protein
MTDEEKIEQAAELYERDLADFKAGVKWRDENPSEKVLALVEALQLATCSTENRISKAAGEALSVWKAE